MKRKRKIIMGVLFLTLFAVWTLLVLTVDVRPIGPMGASVGLAALNGAVRDFIGVNMTLYTVTDLAGLVPLAVGLGFAVTGLVQLIRRRSLFKVDRGILSLGVFYITVIGVYILFELAVINRRPVLINGYHEASYPSSTTVLVLTVMGSALIRLKRTMKKRRAFWVIASIAAAFSAFTVVGRILSGVHWASDIIGGALISSGLLALYSAADGENGNKKL